LIAVGASLAVARSWPGKGRGGSDVRIIRFNEGAACEPIERRDPHLPQTFPLYQHLVVVPAE
jgi:hypothetical protein